MYSHHSPTPEPQVRIESSERGARSAIIERAAVAKLHFYFAMNWDNNPIGISRGGEAWVRLSGE
ncbi:hypothetical protein KR51_00030150 [Rubidibacter lacunae KORDI 51-2]|uniref:Uncharacterized protein n=1 Tax=Rubidibacter lacunae KORDI 51-2 TaxID=582515 RepID=U5DFU6_9CHRO|nr:hypothetical protein KR51_00030150 [Rubidibacter lacunae KORDI 51-2]